jgi:excisionase family DNA binding protein
MPDKNEVLNKITPEYMNLDELSAYCAMSKMTLRRWIEHGMPHYRFGRSIRVRVSDFDAWVTRFRSSGSAVKEQVLDAWNKAAGRSE